MPAIHSIAQRHLLILTLQVCSAFIFTTLDENFTDWLATHSTDYPRPH